MLKLRGPAIAAFAVALGSCAGIQGATGGRIALQARVPGWPSVLADAGLPGGAAPGSPELEEALAEADAYYGMPEAPGGRELLRLGEEGGACAVHLRLPSGRPRGFLVFVHGYREHGLSSPALARAALEAGWAFAGLDLPGHGVSPGATGTVGDFAEYGRVFGAFLESTIAAKDVPILVVGFSTGGAAVAEYLTTLSPGTPPRRERFLLLSPLVRSRGWGASRVGLALGAWALPLLPDRTFGISHDPGWPRLAAVDPLRVRIAPVRWVDALVRWQASLGARAPRPETLRIVWAGEDTVIDPGYGGRALSRLFPAARQERIRGAWHGLPFEGGRYLEAVLAIVGEELAEAGAASP